MRFSNPEDRVKPEEQQPSDAGAAFFITEDIRDDQLFPIDGVEQIQEEKSYGSETANERKASNQQIATAEELNPGQSNQEFDGE